MYFVTAHILVTSGHGDKILYVFINMAQGVKPENSNSINSPYDVEWS